MAEALRIPDDQLDFEADLVFRYHGARFTGIAYELWPNGQTRSEISYVAGLQDGVAREWDDSGQLLGESHYKDSSLHGRLREWSPKGGLRQDATYELGILVASRTWNLNGDLIAEFELTPEHPSYQVLESHRERALRCSAKSRRSDMHFLCLVVGDHPHEALKPFADYLEVPRRKEFLDAEEVASMAEEYRLRPDDLNGLAAKMQEWAREDGGVEDGRLFRWTTSNPQAQFDSYKIGGRFDGYLELLSPRPPGFLGGLFGAKPKSRVNMARKSEVDPELIRKDPPAALLLDGQWHECPISTDRAVLTEWDARFARLFHSVAPDALLTVVDVHS